MALAAEGVGDYLAATPRTLNPTASAEMAYSTKT